MDVLRLPSECGFIAIRIVGNNHKNHVAIFKHFGSSMLQNVVPHSYNSAFKLFLSFDYCHTLKNARNLFLGVDMASSDGVISTNYLKELVDLQEDLIVRPVRNLTKKHICPSNLEKVKGLLCNSQIHGKYI